MSSHILGRNHSSAKFTAATKDTLEPVVWRFTCDFIPARDLSYVLKMDAKKLSEKKEIFSLIWESTMDRSPSSATSLTVIVASPPSTYSRTTKRSTSQKDRTFAGTAIKSFWGQQLWPRIWRNTVTQQAILSSLRMGSSLANTTISTSLSRSMDHTGQCLNKSTTDFTTNRSATRKIGCIWIKSFSMVVLHLRKILTPIIPTMRPKNVGITTWTDLLRNTWTKEKSNSKENPIYLSHNILSMFRLLMTCSSIMTFFSRT